MRKLLERLRPADMRAANANNDKIINEAKNRLHARMNALDIDAADYQQQSRQLRAAFDMVETEIPMRATLPVLQSFLREKVIDSGLDESVLRHGIQL